MKCLVLLQGLHYVLYFHEFISCNIQMNFKDDALCVTQSEQSSLVVLVFLVHLLNVFFFFWGGGGAVWSLVCCAVISIVSSFAVIALDCLLIPGDCLWSVALPRDAVDWYAVRDCGIS